MARTRTHETGTPLAVQTWTWAVQIPLGVIQLALGVLWLGAIGPRPWLGAAFLVLGCFSLVRAWWLATFRTYVTSDGVVVRGVRRRTVAWRDVRTIEERRRHWLTDRVVTITPVAGEPVTVLARASWLDDSFEWNRRVLERRWREHTEAAGPAH